ncbi:MAG: hypothetical protein DRJ18_01390 [Candidatus Methanomethylicota archaeon]|nr:MAG: hypothetical protein DRJ18_01390 [Candidatus Verstraetearchaeota archaeon]
MDNVLIAVLSTQTALIIFMLERIFAVKRCIHNNSVRVARIEERLEVMINNICVRDRVLGGELDE